MTTPAPFALPTDPLSAPPAPLSIQDLMLWTFASGFTLAVQNLTPGIQAWGPVPRGFGVAAACLEGAAVAAALRLAMRWRRGERPMLLHPGHWLLWNAGVLSMLLWLHTYTLFWCSLGVVNDPNNLQLGVVSLWGYLAYMLAAFVLSVVALVGVGTERRAWRWFFGWVVFSCIIMGAGIVAYLLLFTWMQASDSLGPPPPLFYSLVSVASVIWFVVNPLEFLALAAVAIHERLRGTPRDWLHYAGIAIVLAVDALQTGRYLATVLLAN